MLMLIAVCHITHIVSLTPVSVPMMDEQENKNMNDFGDTSMIASQ